MAEVVNHPEALSLAATYFWKGKILKEINYVDLSFCAHASWMHNEGGHISDCTHCTSHYINVEE